MTGAMSSYMVAGSLCKAGSSGCECRYLNLPPVGARSTMWPQSQTACDRGISWLIDLLCQSVTQKICRLKSVKSKENEIFQLSHADCKLFRVLQASMHEVVMATTAVDEKGKKSEDWKKDRWDFSRMLVLIWFQMSESHSGSYSLSLGVLAHVLELGLYVLSTNSWWDNYIKGKKGKKGILALSLVPELYRSIDYQTFEQPASASRTQNL